MVLMWLYVLLIVALFNSCNAFHANMSARMKQELSLQVKDMFLHAYRSYKEHAFPADELMPLSCRGRFRGVEPSRGDVDDALGNFSLTMIDTLDSLFIFNELEEFEDAVKAVISTVTFDSDIDVSVFETNIRVLGGLLGGHVSALALKKNNQSRMTWYTDQLLHMSVDIANRLLPAFETPTGMPLPRVNLRHGVAGLAKQENHTCTACAGTMILEFATLSRLTGLPVFEEKAALGLAYLWKQRNRHSDLVGHVIDVHSGEWIRKESGIGAGFDSYYEYLLKAYVLFGESVYLHRFNTHYEAIKRYVSGPESAEFPFLFLNVLMHRPAQRSRTFMDALFAFWPGLQVLTGDVKLAVASHEFLFQVNKRNTFLPEAFTVDLNVHWAEYLLRPEFIESTYLLHHATGDPYYLAIGEQLVQNLQRHARVPCGFAAIQDVRTMKLLDRLDSFVLAETFKYLYLLFTEPKDLPIALDEYVFTTEAHILPLGLPKVPPAGGGGSHSNRLGRHASGEALPPDYHGDRDHATESWLGRWVQCPAVAYVHTRPHRRRPCPTDRRTGDRGSCDIWQGTSPQRGRLLWLQSTDPQRYYLHCLSSAQSSRRHSLHNTLADHSGEDGLWSLIDVIRRPLRQLAVHFGLSSATAPSSSPDDDDDDYGDGGGDRQGKVNTAKGVEFKMLEFDGALPLRAADFRLNDATHLAILRRMGIEIVVDDTGRMSIRHEQSLAENANMAIAGLLFIHDLLKLSKKKPEAQDPPPQFWHVVLLDAPHFGQIRLPSCPAHFAQFPGELSQSPPDTSPPSQSANSPGGVSESRPPCSVGQTDCDMAHAGTENRWRPLVGEIKVAQPLDACSPVHGIAAAYPAHSLDWSGLPDPEQLVVTTADEEQRIIDSTSPLSGSIALVRRGGCLFIEKARNLLAAGAIGGIIVDVGNESAASRTPVFTMSGETETDRQRLPLAFTMLFAEERNQLLTEMRRTWTLLSRPAVVMLTKQPTPTQTLSSSLETLFNYKLRRSGSSAASGQLVQLVSRLATSPPSTASDSQTDWLFVTPSLRFNISHLPAEDTYKPVCRVRSWYATLHSHLPPVCVVTGTHSRWLLKVRVDEEGKKAFLHQSGDASEVAASWLSLLNHVMDSSHCCAECRGLLLAVVEAAAFDSAGDQTSDSTTLNQGVPMSLSWYNLISECLSYMLISLKDGAPPSNQQYLNENVSEQWQDLVLNLTFLQLEQNLEVTAVPAPAA